MEEEKTFLAAASVLMLHRFQKHFVYIQRSLAIQQGITSSLKNLHFRTRKCTAVRVMKRQPYCKINQHQQIIKIITDPVCDLRKCLHISRPVFQRILHLTSPATDRGWSKEIRLGVFLFWLATGTSYRSVGQEFNMPKTTIHTIVHDVLQQVLSLAKKFIILPENDDLVQVGNAFASLAGNFTFSNVVGAIDVAHVRVRVPQTTRDIFLNEDSVCTIQVQAVCDDKGKFVDIFSGLPGSVDDTTILRLSNLYQHKMYPPPGYAILGNESYPNISSPICVLTPFKESSLNSLENDFNCLHVKAHSVVKNALGQLKTRWKGVFSKTLDCSHTLIPNIIGACAIIHNICIDEGDISQCSLTDLSRGREHVFTFLTDEEVSADNIRDEMMHNIEFALPELLCLREHDYL